MNPSKNKQDKYLDNDKEPSEENITQAYQQQQSQNQSSFEYSNAFNQVSSNADLQKAYKNKENNPEYRGEKLDRNLIDGPIKNRGCSNFICLVFSALFFVGIISLAIFSYANGDINRVGVPQDFLGNKCGFSEKFEEYPYVYFPSLKQLDLFICVMKCPHNEIEDVLVKPNVFYLEIGLFTDDKIPISYDSFREGRTCVPENYKQAQLIKDIKKPEDIYQSHLGDLRNSWPMMVGGLFVVIFLGYFYLFLMKKFAKAMTWLCIFLYMIFLIVAGGLFYGQAKQVGPYTDKSISQEKSSEYMLFAILFWIVAILSAIYLCFKKQKIQMAIAILNCSIDYTRDYRTIFILPLWISVFYGIYIIFWVYTALTIYSSGDPIIKEQYNTQEIQDNQDSIQNIPKPYQHTEYNNDAQNLIIFHVFEFFWISEYTIALTQFIVANSTAMWYFYRDNSSQQFQATADKRNMPGNLRTSIFRAIQQTGTLLLGAAVGGIYSLINITLSLFHKCSEGERNRRYEEIKTHGAVNQPRCSCCVAIAQTYEAYFRFVQKNSYIQAAITGQNFFPSAHNNYYLMQRNQFFFSAMQGVGVMMIFIGKIFIMGCTTFLSYIVIKYADQISDYSISTVLPIVFIGFASYYFGAIFVSIYGTSSDCIVQCYCLEEELYSELRDEEQNRYQRQIPATLQQFLEQNNINKNKNKNNTKGGSKKRKAQKNQIE